MLTYRVALIATLCAATAGWAQPAGPGDVRLTLILPYTAISLHEPLVAAVRFSPAPGSTVSSCPTASYLETEITDRRGRALTPPYRWAPARGATALMVLGNPQIPAVELLPTHRLVHFSEAGRYRLVVRLWPHDAPEGQAPRPLAQTEATFTVGPFDSARLHKVCEWAALHGSGRVDAPTEPAGWADLDPRALRHLENDRAEILASIRHPIVLPYATALAAQSPIWVRVVRTASTPAAEEILRAWATGVGPVADQAKRELRILAEGEPPIAAQGPGAPQPNPFAGRFGGF